MAYRINYGPDLSKEQKGSGKQLRWQIMTAAFLLLFVLLVKQTWPDGADKLRTVFLPSGEGTETAFQEFIDQLHGGDSVGDALTTFCRQVIENAQAD